MTKSVPIRLDIFCRVVDNYGDIGVCWRLARQIAAEYPFQVRLWVDELAALTQIWPGATTAAQQELERVDVRLWGESFAATDAADVVVEAFACELPENYLAAMKQRATPPCWINLEYLSAESWVEGCHGMQSVHPRLGLKKTFFFPGFSTKTGGLLREKSLLLERDRFREKDRRAQLLALLTINAPADNLLISLFGYENPAIGSLLEVWQVSRQPITCLVPMGKILTSINQHWDSSLKIGDCATQGALTLAVIPFLSQIDYDRLLWACDLNFVRGEDSFVRAQWAAKPLIWQIYPQEEDAHLSKLDAFLSAYAQTPSTTLNHAIIALWRRWNQGQDCSEAWDNCLEHYAQWLEHSNNWCLAQVSHDDLAAKLVHLHEKNL